MFLFPVLESTMIGSPAELFKKQKSTDIPIEKLLITSNFREIYQRTDSSGSENNLLHCPRNK
jgi:hypothetical protein